jgi:organic radical activating enzyme
MYNRQIKKHHHFYDENKYSLFGQDNACRFHWDIITICNYNCEYCYSRANESQWNKITSTKTIDEVIYNLSQITREIEVVVLGGEPSKHPKYFYILDKLYNLPNLVGFGNISNGDYKDNSFIDKHEKYKDKFHFNITYHSSQIKDIEKFKETIKYIRQNNFKLNVNVMLAYDFYGVEEIILFCREHNIRYYFNIIFDHTSEAYAITDKEYRQKLNDLNIKYGEIKELVYSGPDGEIFQNDIDVYLNDLSDFHNWNCRNNNYQISVEKSTFNKFCGWSEISIDELNKTDFFMKCPLKQCVCQGKLTSEKYTD